MRFVIVVAGTALLAVRNPSPVCGVETEALAGPADTNHSRSAPASPLSALLIEHGYVEVPLELNRTGLLDVKVEVDGVPMVLVLDTGANNINLDRASARRAKRTVKEVEEKTSALGGGVRAGVTKIDRLVVGKIDGPAESYVVDFSPTNALRKTHGDPACDGVLGGSFLKHYSAVVAYGPRKLYLLDPERQAADPAPLMKKDKYVEVPLALNKNGLLDVTAEVNGLPVLLFLDSGYVADVSLERSSAKRVGLAVAETKGKSSELGGGLAVGRARVERLTVGRLTRAADAQVVDFSPTNATRKANGARECDGVLGGRFMEKCSAVIDYSHQRLYLLDPAGR